MSSAKSIRDWLTEQGLAQHADAFEREQIDLDAVRHLSEENLKDLGLPMGHRVKLVAAIQALFAIPAAGRASAETSGPTPGEPQASAPHTYTPRHLAEKILTSRSALEGERKQVTVLFCDIANSTPLAEKLGAEAMHALLQRFFVLSLEEVHRYEGTVNQFLGDGFMALFGAPVAHEDDARRGVLAALGIRRLIRDQQGELGLPAGDELQVRMDLNTGLVVVGSIGDNLRMDYTAIGDTTHLAARLQQAAGPGEILMNETTARLVRGYVTSQPLPPLAVKGKSETVNAFNVLALGGRRSRLDDDRALSPFVGREREMSILREALDEAQAGRGQVVGMVGEPGVGKSRLLYEFRHLLQERKVSYLEGWCQSFGQSIAYLPLQDWMRVSCGITVTDSPAQIGHRVHHALEQAGLPPEELAPFLLQALGVKEGAERLAQMSPASIKAHTLDTLRRLAMAQSKRSMLVLAIEDLHWIDKTSEAFLAGLIESLPGARILLITTMRPGYSASWSGKSYVTQLPLRVLPAESARRIVEATVERADLADPATESILRKAEGNPLFLEELTLALLEHRGLGAGHALPDTIQGVLAARIDRLPNDAKRTLQTASVLGREFTLRLLQTVCEDNADVGKQLAALKQLEFLYERAEAEGPVFTFKHVLTQEVAYESLLSPHRQALHEAAGRALEAFYPDRLEEYCELLAHHFSRSAEKGKALDYLELANRKAARADAVFDAKDYFEEAMRVLDVLPDTAEHRHRRIALLIGQIHVFILTNELNQYERYLESFAPMAENLSDDGLRGHFQACRGHCQFGFARPDEAIPTLRSAAALCEQAGNFEGAGHAYTHLAWSHLLKGEYEDAVGYEQPALRALARAPNLRLRVYALSAASWACANLARWDLAVEKAMMALRESEQASDAGLVSFGHWTLAIAYIQKGAVEEAVNWSLLAFEGAPTLGDRAWAQFFYGWALARRSPAEAIELLTPLVPMWTGRWWIEALAEVGLGEAYLRAGRLEEARTMLERALEVAGPRGMSLMAAPAARLLGEVLLAMDRPDVLEQARAHFERAMAELERSNAESELALARAGYGRLMTRLGRTGEAREHLVQALATFERLGTLEEPERVRAALADLPNV